MPTFHEIPWKQCLSHKIWQNLKKGWPDEDDSHFFWGLAGQNILKINQCQRENKNWYFVDVGYLTEQIIRYPVPDIVDEDRTYFRVIKGGIHSPSLLSNNSSRRDVLRKKNINVDFPDWFDSKQNRKKILVCPSSQTVTKVINGVSQERWVNDIITEIKKHTDKNVVFRNKPRPRNQWWNTDIRDELKDCHTLVTNMSLCSIDAVLCGVPIYTDRLNIASLLSGTDFSNIDNPHRVDKLKVNQWINYLCQNQFNLEEMKDGTCFEFMRNDK